MTEAFEQHSSSETASDFDDDNVMALDSIGLYLREIARIPLIDAATEVELSKTIEAGLYAERLLDNATDNQSSNDTNLQPTTVELEWMASEGAKAKKQFFESNLRLVVSLAKKYSWSGMPLLDMIQEGNTGLI